MSRPALFFHALRIHRLSAFNRQLWMSEHSTQFRRATMAFADEYARHLFSELDNKPLDRELLTHFAARVKGKGAVCDMGCGPGHIARFLHDAGTNVFGLDVSRA